MPISGGSTTYYVNSIWTDQAAFTTWYTTEKQEQYPGLEYGTNAFKTVKAAVDAAGENDVNLDIIATSNSTSSTNPNTDDCLVVNNTTNNNVKSVKVEDGAVLFLGAASSMNTVDISRFHGAGTIAAYGMVAINKSAVAEDFTGSIGCVATVTAPCSFVSSIEGAKSYNNLGNNGATVYAFTKNLTIGEGKTLTGEDKLVVTLNGTGFIPQTGEFQDGGKLTIENGSVTGTKDKTAMEVSITKMNAYTSPSTALATLNGNMTGDITINLKDCGMVRTATFVADNDDYTYNTNITAVVDNCKFYQTTSGAYSKKGYLTASMWNASTKDNPHAVTQNGNIDYTVKNLAYADNATTTIYGLYTAGNGVSAVNGNVDMTFTNNTAAGVSFYGVNNAGSTADQAILTGNLSVSVSTSTMGTFYGAENGKIAGNYTVTVNNSTAKTFAVLSGDIAFITGTSSITFDGTDTVNGKISGFNNITISSGAAVNATYNLNADYSTAWSNSGTLTVDMTGANALEYKLVDNKTDTAMTLEDYGTVTLSNNTAYALQVEDNDLYAKRVDTTSVKVKALWEGTEIGTEVETGYYYGINAFSDIQSAVNAVAATNGVVTIYDGEYDGFVLDTIIPELAGGKTNLTIQAAEGNTDVNINSMVRIGYEVSGVQRSWTYGTTLKGLNLISDGTSDSTTGYAALCTQTGYNIVVDNCHFSNVTAGTKDYNPKAYLVTTAAKAGGSGNIVFQNGCTFENGYLNLIRANTTSGVGVKFDHATFTDVQANMQAGQLYEFATCTFSYQITSASQDKDFYVIRTNDQSLKVTDCKFTLSVAEGVTNSEANGVWAVFVPRKGATGEGNNIPNSYWTNSGNTVTITDADNAKIYVLDNQDTSVKTRGTMTGLTVTENSETLTTAQILAKTTGYAIVNPVGESGSYTAGGFGGFSVTEINSMVADAAKIDWLTATAIKYDIASKTVTVTGTISGTNTVPEGVTFSLAADAVVEKDTVIRLATVQDSDAYNTFVKSLTDTQKANCTVQGWVASITKDEVTTKYYTLADAVAAVEDNQTIQMLVTDLGDEKFPGYSGTKSFTIKGLTDAEGVGYTSIAGSEGDAQETENTLVFKNILWTQRFYKHSIKNATFENCKFTGEAGVRYGYIPDGGTWTIRNCEFDQTGYYAFHIDESGGSVVAEDCIFRSTVSICENGPASFTDCQFLQNQSGQQEKGDVGLNLYSDTVFDGCTFDTKYTEGNIYTKVNGIVIELKECELNGEGKLTDIPGRSYLKKYTALVVVDGVRDTTSKLFTSGSFVTASVDTLNKNCDTSIDVTFLTSDNYAGTFVYDVTAEGAKTLTAEGALSNTITVPEGVTFALTEGATAAEGTVIRLATVQDSEDYENFVDNLTELQAANADVQGWVCSIGDNKYYTMQEAFDAVTAGQTINLLCNVPEKTAVTTKTGVAFTIDLAGFNYENEATLTNNGSVTLTDSTATTDNHFNVGSWTNAADSTLTADSSVEFKSNDYVSGVGTVNINGDATIKKSATGGSDNGGLKADGGTLTVHVAENIDLYSNTMAVGSGNKVVMTAHNATIHGTEYAEIFTAKNGGSIQINEENAEQNLTIKSEANNNQGLVANNADLKVYGLKSLEVTRTTADKSINGVYASSGGNLTINTAGDALNTTISVKGGSMSAATSSTAVMGLFSSWYTGSTFSTLNANGIKSVKAEASGNGQVFAVYETYGSTLNVNSAANTTATGEISAKAEYYSNAVVASGGSVSVYGIKDISSLATGNAESGIKGIAIGVNAYGETQYSSPNDKAYLTINSANAAHDTSISAKSTSADDPSQAWDAYAMGVYSYKEAAVDLNGIKDITAEAKGMAYGLYSYSTTEGKVNDVDIDMAGKLSATTTNEGGESYGVYSLYYSDIDIEGNGTAEIKATASGANSSAYAVTAALGADVTLNNLKAITATGTTAVSVYSSGADAEININGQSADKKTAITGDIYAEDDAAVNLKNVAVTGNVAETKDSSDTYGTVKFTGTDTVDGAVTLQGNKSFTAAADSFSLTETGTDAADVIAINGNLSVSGEGTSVAIAGTTTAKASITGTVTNSADSTLNLSNATVTKSLTNNGTATLENVNTTEGWTLAEGSVTYTNSLTNGTDLTAMTKTGTVNGTIYASSGTLDLRGVDLRVKGEPAIYGGTAENPETLDTLKATRVFFGDIYDGGGNQTIKNIVLENCTTGYRAALGVYYDTLTVDTVSVNAEEGWYWDQQYQNSNNYQMYTGFGGTLNINKSLTTGEYMNAGYSIGGTGITNLAAGATINCLDFQNTGNSASKTTAEQAAENIAKGIVNVNGAGATLNAAALNNHAITTFGTVNLTSHPVHTTTEGGLYNVNYGTGAVLTIGQLNFLNKEGDTTKSQMRAGDNAVTTIGGLSTNPAVGVDFYVTQTSETTVNKDGGNAVQFTGDIVFTAYADANSEAKFTLNLDSSDDYFTGAIRGTTSATNRWGKWGSAVMGDEVAATDNIKGMTLTVTNGAVWNMTGDSAVNTLTVTGATLSGSEAALQIQTSGSFTLDYTSSITVNSITNNGTITVDMTDADKSSYLLINSGSTASTYGTVSFAGSTAYTQKVYDGDLYAVLNTATPTITVTSYNGTYDGQAHEIGYSFTQGILEGDDKLNVTLNISSVKNVSDSSNDVKVTGYSITRVVGGETTDVTDYYKTLYGEFTTVGGTASVTAKELTVEGTTVKDKVYDGYTDATIDQLGTLVGVVEGDTVNLDAEANFLDKNAGANKDVWVDNQISGKDANNYVVQDEYKTASITKRDVTLTSGSDSWEYDGKAHSNTNVADTTAGKTDKGYVSGEEFAYTFTGSQLFVGTSKNTFTCSTSDTANVDNYNVTTEYGTLEITGRTVPLTITVADQSKTYDGTASFDTTDYTVDGELAYGDTITVTLSNTNVNAGTYEDGITATYKIVHDNGDGTTTDVTSMYLNVTVDAGDLTIHQKALTVTGTTADGKMYDGNTDAVTHLGTVDGVVTGDDVTVTAKGTFADKNAENGKTVAIDYTLTGEKAANYTVANTTTVADIEKRDVTLTSASDSKVYDGTPLTNDNVNVSGSGFVTGEGATYNVTGSQTKVGDSKNTFTYTLNDGTKAGNYTIEIVEGTLTVTKPGTAITITAASASKMYDGKALTNANYTYTQGVLVEGDNLTVEMTPDSTITNAGNTANKVDSYKVTNAAGEDVKANYTFTDSVDGMLTVTKRDVTLTSNSDSKMYDGTALTGTVEVTGSGFVEGEATVSASSITDAGTTTNTIAINEGTGYMESNYDISKTEGTLTVTKRDVTLTSNSDSKMYDGTALTGKVEVTGSGFVTGEATASATGTITDAGVITNTIAINEGAGYKESNYDISKTEGTLTVTKRDAVLTSATAWKLYDGTALTNDTVTVSGSGFVDGEGASYTFTGTQTEVGSSANAFTYTLNDGTKAGNYDIATANGTLTVYASETLAVNTAWTTGVAEDEEVTLGGNTYNYLRNAYSDAQSAMNAATVKTTGIVLAGSEESAGDLTVGRNITITTAETKNGAATIGTLTVNAGTVTLTDTAFIAAGAIVNNSTISTDVDTKFAAQSYSGEGTLNITGDVTDNFYKVLDLAEGETFDLSKVTWAGKEGYELSFDAAEHDLVIKKAESEKATQTEVQETVVVTNKVDPSTSNESTYVMDSVVGDDTNKNVIIAADETSKEMKVTGEIASGKDGNVTVSNSGEELKVTRDVTADEKVNLTTSGSNETTAAIEVSGAVSAETLNITSDKENGSSSVSAGEGFAATTANVSNTGAAELNVTGGITTNTATLETTGAGSVMVDAITSETGTTEVKTTTLSSAEGSVTIEEVAGENVNIIHEGANNLNVTKSVTVTGEDKSETEAAAKIQNITNDSDLVVAANVYVKGATLEIRNETNQELQATGKLEVKDIRIYNNDWTSTEKVGEIKITQEIEAAGKLEITNANLTETEGVADSGVISLGTQEHTAQEGMTIVNKTENVINGGYVESVEQAANVTVASGDVKIANDGHINANVTAENSTMTIVNTSANTLTGSYSAAEIDLQNISGGAVRNATVTATDTITVSGIGTIENSTLNAANITVAADANQVVDENTCFTFTNNWTNNGTITVAVSEGAEGEKYTIVSGTVADTEAWGNVISATLGYRIESDVNGVYAVKDPENPVVDGKVVTVSEDSSYNSITIKKGGTLVVAADKVSTETLIVESTGNTITGNTIAAGTVRFVDGAELGLDKDQYDSFMANTEFASAGKLNVTYSTGNALRPEDVDVLLAKENVNNVAFEQDMIDINKLNVKLTKEAAISFRDGYGTAKSDTIRFYKDTNMTFGSEGNVINLEEGYNKIQIDKNADIQIFSDLDNVSKVTTASGSKAQIGDITFQKGRNATLKASGTSFEAEAINGTDRKTTLTTAKETAFTAEDILFGSSRDKISTGKSSLFAAGNITSADTISLGAYSTTKVGDIAGTKKLTIGNGKEGQIATLEAGEVFGTAENDNFNFGNWNDVDLDSLDFEAGNDKLSIGKGSEVKIGSLDFGEGKDKLSIGKGATLSVETLDVDSLDTLTMSKDALLCIGNEDQVKAAQDKWSKYADQIKLA